MALMAIVNSCACEKNYFAEYVASVIYGGVDLWKRQKNVLTTGASLHAEKKDKNPLLS